LASLRVGIVLDKASGPAWIRALLESLAREDQIHIAALAFDPPASSPPLLHALFTRLDRALFPVAADALAQCDFSDLLPTPGDLEALAGSDLDVLLDLSSDSNPTQLGHTARFGTWTYDQSTRTGTGGLVEVLSRQPITPVEVSAWIGDETQVLYRSFSGTHALSPHRNSQRLYWKASALMPRLLRRLHATGGQSFFATHALTAPNPASVPISNGWLLSHLVHFSAGWPRGVWSEIWHRREWTVRYGQSSSLPDSLEGFVELQPGRGRFWADPFPFVGEGKSYVFVEELEYKKKKGYISVIERDGDRLANEATKVLERPYHLSYPLVFTWQGEHYMLPETSANRTVEVYKATNFPWEWTLHQILMQDLRAVDCTLCQHEGRWWLFACIAETPAIPARDELFLFYADHPLSQSWIPHPLNPVVSDVRRARPAGRVFTRGNRLYRPAQDCSRRYGYGLRIQEITRLDVDGYEEREVRAYLPAPGSALVGFHTFNQDGTLTLIDAKVRRRRLFG
jgi:hypothetical protein